MILVCSKQKILLVQATLIRQILPHMVTLHTHSIIYNMKYYNNLCTEKCKNTVKYIYTTIYYNEVIVEL